MKHVVMSSNVMPKFSTTFVSAWRESRSVYSHVAKLSFCIPALQFFYGLGHTPNSISLSKLALHIPSSWPVYLQFSITFADTFHPSNIAKRQLLSGEYRVKPAKAGKIHTCLHRQQKNHSFRISHHILHGDHEALHHAVQAVRVGHSLRQVNLDKEAIIPSVLDTLCLSRTIPRNVRH